MATKRNAVRIRPLPSIVPAAANNFTSPAPVAPNTCPGSIIRKPNASPASADVTVMLLTPIIDNVIPVAAVATQTTFGIRRRRMSMTAAVPSPVHNAPSTMRSDACANGRPEHSVQVLAEQTDPTKCHKGNQRRKDAVLEQVLPLFEPQQSIQ